MVRHCMTSQEYVIYTDTVADWLMTPLALVGPFTDHTTCTITMIFSMNLTIIFMLSSH